MESLRGGIILDLFHFSVSSIGIDCKTRVFRDMESKCGVKMYFGTFGVGKAPKIEFCFCL